MDQVDIVIRRPRALREYLDCSTVTAWRRERNNPNWPRPVDMGGGRIGYKLSEIRRYVESLKFAQRAA
ncbi:MAG: hypothetical protein IT521_15340 [Burkholderiales bacterium]|nr:hypothetical protein [Burkholderiales bacterium]